MHTEIADSRKGPRARNRFKPSQRKKCTVFDTIKRIDTIENGSVWQGEKGRYVIKHVEPREKHHSPIAHVMLNSKYFSGLFRTKRKDIFSADIKTDAGKQYLLFLWHEHEDNINIVNKSTPMSKKVFEMS